MKPVNASKPGSSLNRLAISNLLAQSGEQIALAAAPIVAVVMLGADIAEAGGLQTILTLPFLLLAIPAGLLADRMSRRRLMVAAEALRAASMLMVLALILSGAITWPLLAALGFLAVTGTVVFSVAGPALVPS
jgi:MFS family permease